MDDRVDDREDQLRDRAYRIWTEEGCPEEQTQRQAALKRHYAGTAPLGERIKSAVRIDSRKDVPDPIEQRQIAVNSKDRRRHF
jgi:DUF2934 family protein